MRRVGRTHPHAGQAGGPSRVKRVVRENIWEQKTALNFYLLLRAVGPVPKGGYHGDKLKPANLFGGERQKLVTPLPFLRELAHFLNAH
jgi:hypothetical protein